MYKQILVPVDGSQTALTALRQALGIAKAFQADLFVVHVIDPYPFMGVGSDYALGQNEYLAAATGNANRALSEALEMAREAGVDVESAVVEGHAPEDGIVATAKTCGADLIVIGSHGRRGIEKLLLGSVTQRVLQDARVPVLVVRGSDA